MSKIMEAKQNAVDEIKGKIDASISTVIVDYRGLNVAEITELRKQLREASVDFKVYKNSLTRRAVADHSLTGLEESLTGPNAIAFSNEDVIAPAKILNNFSKEHEALEIKAGIIEGKVTSAKEITALAELPSRDGLLSMLCSVLQAPVRNFALATKAVADQKQAQEA